MGHSVLILGQSGTGKSRSAYSLNPKETFIIGCTRKSLPWKAFKANYKPFSKSSPEGNYIVTDDPTTIVSVIKYVSDKRPEIKNLIIDDFQYIMAHAYMRRAKETGYGKFTDINLGAFSIIDEAVNKTREDLNCAILSHVETDTDAMGNRLLKAKTIGKMIDQYITLEGEFTVVLFTDVAVGEDSKVNYYFLTQNNGANTCKSPEGMFDELRIPNDLGFVFQKMAEYEQ